ncbi:MAG TPA: peptidase M48 [Roseibacterium sp.]|nr:peptidase M48 [Roseibacterium sp.]
MRWLILFLSLTLTACEVTVSDPQTGITPGASTLQQPAGIPLGANGFAEVVGAVQPIAISECRRRTRGANCNFVVVIDPNRRALPNAFQSLDKDGRPVLTFTGTLIAKLRNRDELAFILSHEAAHHISGHLVRQHQNALAGAAVFAGLATLNGASAADILNAQKLGATVGARTYSKDFELEADELGTIITYRAGYNPLVGAQFFTVLPDPGDRFLGTHPPNAARLDAVRRASDRLGLTG